MRLAALLALVGCAGSGVVVEAEPDCPPADGGITEPAGDDASVEVMPDRLAPPPRCGPESSEAVDVRFADAWTRSPGATPLTTAVLTVDDDALPSAVEDPGTRVFGNCHDWRGYLDAWGLDDPVPAVDFARFDLVLHQAETGRCGAWFQPQVAWVDDERVVSGILLTQVPGPSDGDCLGEERVVLLVEKGTPGQSVALEFRPVPIVFE